MAFKKKYTSDRIKNVSNLKDSLSNFYSEYKFGDKLIAFELREKWFELMGHAINRQTSSLTINNGILYIKITSPVIKNELSFAKENVKTHLNRALKKDIIKEVVIL
ncbi:MAG: DUF721 domain-containing protein [Ichthyobacteriaceae bacterium]|nr:DUF721 domain-containing protein [Ichthyobacteriaceae bacterium]